MSFQPTAPLLRPSLRGRHGPGSTHSRESPTTPWGGREHCCSQQSHTQLGQVPLAQIACVQKPRLQRNGRYGQRNRARQVPWSDPLQKRYGQEERVAKARKHFNTLHHFWRHSGLPVHWKLRIYNAVFIPMLTHGMESASLSQHDLHRLEAFHSKALRKMHRIPATFYTKILEPTQPTTTNQQLREQTSQPPLTHHIHRSQLKLFGHILRAQDECLDL